MVAFKPVTILGMGEDGADGLSPAALQRLVAARLVAGSRRHLDRAGPFADRVETFEIAGNFKELVRRLETWDADGPCVVLASGDPLLFGVGHLLIAALGRDRVEVIPSVSSLQLAFARAGVSWHDAAIVSLDGGPPGRVLRKVLGRPTIGVFTQGGDGPSIVADYFLERGLDDYEAWVGEELGGPSERLTAADLADLRGRSFGDLNVVVLRRRPSGDGISWGDQPRWSPFAIASTCVRADASGRGRSPRLTDDLLALIASRFHDLPEGPIWDLGAGDGEVAVCLALQFPDEDVLAFEPSADQAVVIRENRRRFQCYNLRVLQEGCPGTLVGEEEPAGVFLGRVRGQALVREAVGRLRPGGLLVADFAAVEELARGLDWLRAAGWPTEVMQLQISQGRARHGLTVLGPSGQAWLVRSVKPVGFG